MKLMRTTAAALGAAALVVSIAGCSASGSPEEASDAGPGGGTLRIGTADDIQSWDPVAANTGQNLQMYQGPYDTLLRAAPNGELLPMLATEWSYDDAQTALTIDLVSGVTFSDGEAFDAEAVKANLEHFKNGQGPQTSQLASLAAVDVIDDDTLTLNLSEADPALVTYLSQAAGFMASPVAIEAGGLAQEPVGTGAYVMDTAATVAGSQYVFTAREDYWASDLQQFSSVEYIYLDDTALLNALVAGQVDSALIEHDALAQVESAGRDVLQTVADWEGLVLFDRGGQLVPALGDTRVRQAINHAIDRDALNEAMAAGAAEPTQQIFDPKSDAYLPDLEDRYSYDPERARELLAEAGYPDGFSMTVPAPGALGNAWTLIGQYLGDVGIKVTPDPIPFEDFRGNIAQQKYPAGLFRFNLSDPWGNTIRNYISTDAGVWNPFKSQTDELDALLNEVQLGGDDYQERAAAVNEYVVEEAWFVPFYRPLQNYAFDGQKVTVVSQAGTPVPYLYNFSPASQ